MVGDSTMGKHYPPVVWVVLLLPVLLADQAMGQDLALRDSRGVRLSAGAMVVKSETPRDRHFAYQIAMQAFVRHAAPSMIVEASYLEWDLGETFRGQVGGLPISGPPDHVAGRELGLWIGPRVKRLGGRKTTWDLYTVIGLVHHHEIWEYSSNTVGPPEHGESQLVAEVRVQVALSRDPTSPLLELAGGGVLLRRQHDTRGPLMNRELLRIGVLLPIYSPPE